MHPAIQLCLRHNGKVVLNRAIGHGWGNAPTDPPDAEKVAAAPVVRGRPRLDDPKVSTTLRLDADTPPHVVLLIG